MANLRSIATAAFTTSTTWEVASAVTAGFLDSEVGSTNSTTSYVYSATFTLAATNVTAVGVKIAARNATTGTMSIILANNTSPGTREGELTINCADINAAGNGWYFFKFGSAVAPNGTDVYKVGFKTSVNAEITLYRDGTAGNWSRFVSLVTTAAPGANDSLFVAGEVTGTGTQNTYTVTMDDTSGTSYGSTTPPQSVTINNYGTMTNGVTASTAYTFLHKGVAQVNGGGTLNVGTSGTRMPSTSTAVYTMNSAANVDSGWIMANGSTVNCYGVSKTRWTYLNTDEAVASTVIGVVDTTGWAVSDVLCFASTTRTATQAENKTVLTVDSSVQVTLTAGLTNAHSGTSPTQCEVGNLTSNVKFTGASSSLGGYWTVAATATVNVRDTEFTFMGSVTSNKRSIDVNTTTGTFDMRSSSVHDNTVSNALALVISAVTSGTVNIDGCVFYNVDNRMVWFSAAMSGTPVFNNNLLMKMVQSDALLYLNDVGGTITNNHIASSPLYGMQLVESSGAIGTWSGNTCHSCAGNGLFITLNNLPYGTITSQTIWRCNDFGAKIANAQTYGTPPASVLYLDGWTCFGNATANFEISTSCGGITFNNATFNGDTTFSTANGIQLTTAGAGYNLIINNSNFSTVSGIKTAHTTADVNSTGGSSLVQITSSYCIFAATTVFNSMTLDLIGSYFGITAFGQSATDHRCFTPSGTTKSDTVIFKTASPSERILPSSAITKMRSGSKIKSVLSGASLTASVWVRTSASGDSGGVAYVGANPRLIVVANPAIGITADVVLDTFSVGTGTWELLTGATASVTADGALEFYIDCSGANNGQWINVDDWTIV